MKLGIDLHVLQGINQGSKTYLDNIYTSIQSLPSNIEYFFFFNRNHSVPEKWSKYGEVVYFDSLRNLARIGYDAARQQKKYGLDAFHSQYITPVFSSSKDIVTIHDVLFETHPQYFSTAFNIRSKILVRRSAKRADCVLTVSNYSKDMICEIYGIAPSRVAVTPNGVNVDEFFSVDAVAARENLMSRYGLDRYILTVGRLEPRKNHLTLLKAYKSLKIRVPETPPLVIVGQRDFGFQKIFDFIEKNHLSETVRIIEDANFSTLKALYKCAHLFVYASFAEGFGIPPLEAMAAGCPVICSNTTSMKEVFADGAILVDPNDSIKLAAAIEESLFDDAVNERMRENSLSIARRYSWEKSAAELLRAVNGIS